MNWKKNMDGGGDYNAIVGPVAVGTRGTVGSLIRKEIEYFRKKKMMKMKTDYHQLPQPTTLHKLFNPSSYISDHHHHQEAAAATATAGSRSDNYYYYNNNNISNKRKARQSSSTTSTSTSSSSWFFGMKWNMKKKQRVAAAAAAPAGLVDKDVVIPPFSYVILKDHLI